VLKYTINFVRRPETTVTDYKLTLRNIPEEQRSCWQFFFSSYLSYRGFISLWVNVKEM